ncbi:hypothetical protein LCGC14_2439580 [marine sediment metagenome]|uniref:Uncharacterized protein n=1 Tax=marine sediment metagenome TaxID=412755 RepID=A0A0F9DWE1_9ZZZZ
MTGQLLAKSQKIPTLLPSLKTALAGKTERRYGEEGMYTVEGPWEPWEASDEVREEARVWLEAIGDVEKPLERRAFEDAMLGLSYTVGMPKTGKIDAKGRLRAYHAALGDLPGVVVLEGIEEAIKTCKWFPGVAELRGLMEPQAKELRLQIERARTLARKPEPKPKLVAQILKGYATLTEAQRVEHEQRMAKLRVKLGFDTGKARGLNPVYVPFSDEEREKTLRKLEGR